MAEPVLTDEDLPVVNAMADAIRAYLDAEAPELSAQMFNSDVEEIAMRVLPIAQAAACARVAAYLERAGEQKRRNALDTIAPGFGEIEAATLREAAGWCRDDTIWRREERS